MKDPLTELDLAREGFVSLKQPTTRSTPHCGKTFCVSPASFSYYSDTTVTWPNRCGPEDVPTADQRCTLAAIGASRGGNHPGCHRSMSGARVCVALQRAAASECCRHRCGSSAGASIWGRCLYWFPR